MAEMRIGTSAFTAAGWDGTFYPQGIAAREQLTYYSTQFDTVELDNTFYRTPAISTVKGWYARTPPGFVFAAKVPQVITHEKMLLDCKEDLKAFLGTMDELQEKLGPLLFQFGYFNRSKFKSGTEFLARLKPFLEKLPIGYKFALEIRNQYWLDARFVETLREHRVALALIDQSWMPRPWEIKGNLDLVTSDFTYLRWLGDRKEIEEQTTELGQDNRRSHQRIKRVGGRVHEIFLSEYQNIRVREQSLRRPRASYGETVRTAACSAQVRLAPRVAPRRHDLATRVLCCSGAPTCRTMQET
jgi:uncharacterized protein YecE (DUF72 family)